MFGFCMFVGTALRLGLLVYYLCTSWISQCSGLGVLFSILGLLMAPLTTIAYIIARTNQPTGDLSGNMIFLIIVGVVADFAFNGFTHHAMEEEGISPPWA